MKTISKTAHTCNDGRGPMFGKKTAGCPRCDELAAGSAPRGWNKREDNRKAFLAYLKSQECVGHAPQRNPGGYCVVCGKGVDYS